MPPPGGIFHQPGIFSGAGSKTLWWVMIDVWHDISCFELKNHTKIIKMTGLVLCNAFVPSLPWKVVVWECNYSLPLGPGAEEFSNTDVALEGNAKRNKHDTIVPR